MGKHESYTPGPWTADHSWSHEHPSAASDPATPIYADEAPEGERMPAMAHGPKHTANARLIAAAPELLEAARRSLSFILNMAGTVERSEVSDALRSAIAKAMEGGE